MPVRATGSPFDTAVGEHEAQRGTSCTEWREEGRLVKEKSVAVSEKRTWTLKVTIDLIRP